jgi:hypothetical protein
MTKLIEEIEEDHPELTMYQQLRSMSQVTGPAAERLVGDAASLIDEARSNYDTQSIKLFQMAVAIAGWRANTGAWGNSMSSQQQAFAPFDLESYNQGRLDFEIAARPIVPSMKLSPDEQRAAMEAAERGFKTRAQVVEALGGDPNTDLALIDDEQALQRQREADMAQVALEEAQRRMNQEGNAERLPVQQPAQQGA